MAVQWLTPAALWLGALVAVPMTVHLLARQRRRPVRFPTLRFVEAASASSRRRWLVREPGLLAARMAIVMAVATALAGPVVVTASRQARRDSQVARAVVVVPEVAARDEVAATDVDDHDGVRRVFTTADVRQGLADAAAWVESQGPSRREIVVIGPLPRDAVATADVAAVPSAVGLRFMRIGALPPATRSRERLQWHGDTLWRVTESVTATASSTTVDEQRRAPESDRLVVVASPPAQRADAEAARRAVLRRGVVLGGPAATEVSMPWTGDVATLAAAIDARTLSVSDDQSREAEPIDEASLQAWTRPAAPLGPSTAVDAGDRRGLWAAVLALLALEAWLRRRPA